MISHRPRRPPAAAAAGAAALIAAALGSPASGAPSGPGQADPRIELVELQAQGRHRDALARTTSIERESPELARRLALPYLRAHLHDLLGERRAAASAFADVVAGMPALASHARLRIATDQEALGHPEVAAGVVASLLAGPAPAALLDPAAHLLERTIRGGGDCRMVDALRGEGWNPTARRTLRLVHAECALRGGASADAAGLWRALLIEKVTDAPALAAAERLLALDAEQKDPALAALVGASLQHHREFDRSAPLLARLVAGYGQQLTATEFKLTFDHARSQFWQGRFETAAQLYDALAQRPLAAQKRGQALFHRGRSLELSGDWPAAVVAYLDAHRVDPIGEHAASAVLAAARLEWRQGNQAHALRLAEMLRNRTAWRSERARALLFFIASDLSQGAIERSAGWLADPALAGAANAPEVKFWRARLQEANEQPEAAARQYLEVMANDPFHPLALAASRRIRGPALRATTERLGRGYAAGATGGDLLRAFLAVRDDPAAAAAARQVLRAFFARQPHFSTYLGLEPATIESWTLWQAPLERPEDLLLALGLWHEGAPAALRHFPVTQPRLALAASQRLTAAGEAKRGLAIAEILSARKPAGLPSLLVPDSLRRQLYPLAYQDQWRTAALERNLDPHLLAAIMREESRFDPYAFSRAAARGLTQFVLPTARRFASQVGIDRFEPDQLYQPQVAIKLGAAYLGELAARYRDRESQMVAAYNAGEAQAELWQSHCFSTDPAEYWSKVSFRETRAYLQRVLASRAQYDEVYGPARFPLRAGAATAAGTATAPAPVAAAPVAAAAPRPDVRAGRPRPPRDAAPASSSPAPG